MDQTTKRFVPVAFFIFAAANLFTYLISYVAAFMKNGVFGTLVEYLCYYASVALEFLATPIVATLVLLVFAQRGASRAISSALFISSARIFYVVPAYFEEYILSYGALDFDALILALLYSMRAVLLLAVGAFISLYAVVLVLKLTLKKTHKEAVSDLPRLLKMPADLDFLKPECLPILVPVLIKFAFELLSEIIHTVSFFVSYGSDYSGIELLTMFTNYVYLFILLVASYFVCYRIKNSLTTANEK